MGNMMENVLSALVAPKRAHLYQYYHFNRPYRARTPFGFIAPYELRGQVKVEDPDVFQAALDHAGGDAKNVVNRIADAFHDEIFLPLFEKERQFFLYDCNSYGQVILTPWRYDETPDGSLQVQPCSYYGKEGLNGLVNRSLPHFNRFGCVINVVNFVCFEEENALAKENIDMIHPQALAVIRENGLYLKMMESLCIAALHERAKLIGQIKTYGRDGVCELRTHIMGTVLKISWKNAKAGEGWSLLGYRRTGGFAANEFGDGENGVLVVDSAEAEGTTVETTLPPNEPVYYTFFLRKVETPLFSNQGYYVRDRVGRFAETIPDADTVKVLEKQLEETRLKAQIADAQRKAEEAGKANPTFDEQRRRGVESQLRLAKDALGLLRAVDEIEGDAIREFESAPDRFTPERAEAWRDEVVDLCARLRENVRRLV